MQRRGMILAVLLVGGPVLAQAPVGPSTAVLNGARFGLFGEYGQADTDIRFKGAGKESFDFRTAFGGFAAALTDRWDLFVRVGGSQAETAGFDGNWNVGWGLGTRVTALQWNAFSWGLLAQFTNVVSRHDTVIFPAIPEAPPEEAEEELNVGEYVFATGPAWRQGPLSLYGGFFVRYADGDVEVFAETFDDRFTIDARWDVGGYVGGQVTLFKIDPAQTNWFSRCDLTVEGRFSGDSTSFSAGILLPFGGEY